MINRAKLPLIVKQILSWLIQLKRFLLCLFSLIWNINMGRKESQTIFISLIPDFGTKWSLFAVRIIDRLYHRILSPHVLRSVQGFNLIRFLIAIKGRLLLTQHSWFYTLVYKTIYKMGPNVGPWQQSSSMSEKVGRTLAKRTGNRSIITNLLQKAEGLIEVEQVNKPRLQGSCSIAGRKVTFGDVLQQKGDQNI